MGLWQIVPWSEKRRVGADGWCSMWADDLTRTSLADEEKIFEGAHQSHGTDSEHHDGCRRLRREHLEMT